MDAFLAVVKFPVTHLSASAQCFASFLSHRPDFLALGTPRGKDYNSDVPLAHPISLLFKLLL